MIRYSLRRGRRGVEGYVLKYSLDVDITCNNAGVRTAVISVLPLKTDSRVDGSDKLYNAPKNYIDDDGNGRVTAMIRFHVENDRLGVLNALKGLSGMFTQCEVPSHVKEHICYNDDDSDECVVTSVWEK